MISFYLDDILLNDTPKYKGLKEVIELDTDLNAWVHHFNKIELEFTGDGFNYIKAKKLQYGYNYRVSVKIVIAPQSGSIGSGDVIYGFIYLTDIDIEHTYKKITAPLIETFFLGTIKQNQKAVIYFDGLVKTLNGETLVDVPDEVGLDMFDPADGMLITTINGIELASAIASAVGYITDNAVDFQDNYFAALGAGKEKYLLCNGNQVRTQDTTALRIKTSETFDKLMENVYKLFNVWWYIDYTTLKPKFIIDTLPNILDSIGGITLENVKHIKESFNQDDFYTSIRVGSDKFRKPPSIVYTSYLQFINGYTHHEEVFTSKNNTMIDNELNLITSWVIDHNVLNTVLVDSTADPMWDSDNFLIQYDNVMGQAYPATFANLEASTRAIYNEQLTNFARLKRFRLPMELGFDSGLTNNNFEAHIGTDVVHTGVTAVSKTLTPFDTEDTDPNNNYDPTAANYDYTTPSAPLIEGNYGFDVALRIVFNGIPTGPNRPCVLVRIFIEESFASTTIKQPYFIDLYAFSNSGPEGQLFSASRNFYMNAGDFVDCHYLMMSGEFPLGGAFAVNSFTFDATILSTVSIFKTSYVQNQGGLIIGPADIKNYHGGIIEYKKSLPLSTWKELKSNSIQSITTTTGDGRMVEAKIKSIERDVLTGATDFKLMTKESRIGL